jgi:MFS family permease
MANATIAPSLPGLRDHFAATPEIETLSGLLLTLPSLAILLSAGLWGAMADRFNRQWLLVGSGLLYALGGTSGLWAESFEAMLAGRAVLGLGVAGTMTLAMTWGADLWHGEARARFLGRQGAAMSVGGIVVSVLGGALAAMHWRGAFAVYGLVIPVVVFAAIALAPHVAARAARSAPPAPARGGAPGFPWGAFAFVRPLAFLFMAVFYALPTRLPFHLAEMGIGSPLAIGLVMSMMTLFAIPGSLLCGRLRRHMSAMAVFSLSYGLMGLGLMLTARAEGVVLVTIGAIVMGIGMGPSMPNDTTSFMAHVPPMLRGRASGMLTTAFFAGQFASPIMTARLVGWFGLSGAFEALAAVLLGVALALGIAAARGPGQAAEVGA